MEQLLVGGLLGALALGVIAGGVLLLIELKNIAAAVKEAVSSLNRTIKVYEKAGDSSAALMQLTATNRKLLVSIDGMSAALKAFTGIMFAQQPPDDQGPGDVYPSYAPGGPGKPPAPPFVNEYATIEEAGMMTQSDEDLAEVELQREAQERGEPTVTDILGWQREEDIRGEV